MGRRELYVGNRNPDPPHLTEDDIPTTHLMCLQQKPCPLGLIRVVVPQGGEIGVCPSLHNKIVFDDPDGNVPLKLAEAACAATTESALLTLRKQRGEQ